MNPDICVNSKGQRIGHDLSLRKMTVKEIQQFNCGGLVNPRFPRQRISGIHKIPTLEEFFLWLKNHSDPNAKKVLLNIETKLKPGKEHLALPPAEFAAKLVELVKKYKLDKRVTIQSFDFRTLKEARKIAPHISQAALVSKKISLEQLDALIKELKVESSFHQSISG